MALRTALLLICLVSPLLAQDPCTGADCSLNQLASITTEDCNATPGCEPILDAAGQLQTCVPSSLFSTSTAPAFTAAAEMLAKCSAASKQQCMGELASFCLWNAAPSLCVPQQDAFARHVANAISPIDLQACGNFGLAAKADLECPQFALQSFCQEADVTHAEVEVNTQLAKCHWYADTTYTCRTHCDAAVSSRNPHSSMGQLVQGTPLEQVNGLRSQLQNIYYSDCYSLQTKDACARNGVCRWGNQTLLAARGISVLQAAQNSTQGPVLKQRLLPEALMEKCLLDAPAAIERIVQQSSPTATSSATVYSEEVRRAAGCAYKDVVQCFAEDGIDPVCGVVDSKCGVRREVAIRMAYPEGGVCPFAALAASHHLLRIDCGDMGVEEQCGLLSHCEWVVSERALCGGASEPVTLCAPKLSEILWKFTDWPTANAYIQAEEKVRTCARAEAAPTSTSTAAVGRTTKKTDKPTLVVKQTGGGGGVAGSDRPSSGGARFSAHMFVYACVFVLPGVLAL